MSPTEVVEGFTTPAPFTAETIGASPDGYAVHVVRDIDGAVVYVGESKNLRQRLCNHLSGGSNLREQLLAELAERGITEAYSTELARFTVSWRELSDTTALRDRLIHELKPKYNRRLPVVAATVWWINQGRSFDEEDAVGIVFAETGGPAFAHHRDVGRMQPGEVVVHYRRGNVVALGQVVAHPLQARRPYGAEAERDHGWLTRVEYFRLTEPIPLSHLPDRVGVDGPFNSAGGIKQGYLYELPRAFADEVQNSYADRWPPGSPWSVQERRFWLFQANPEQWNLEENLAALPVGHVEDWTVTLPDGDETRRRRGLVAVGQEGRRVRDRQTDHGTVAAPGTRLPAGCRGR